MTTASMRPVDPDGDVLAGNPVAPAHAQAIRSGDTFPTLTSTRSAGDHLAAWRSRRRFRRRADLPRVLVSVLQRAACRVARAADAFEELAIKVVAFSVDDEATSSALVEKPISHSRSGTALTPTRSHR
jgi:hypothetical protein